MGSEARVNGERRDALRAQMTQLVDETLDFVEVAARRHDVGIDQVSLTFATPNDQATVNAGAGLDEPVDEIILMVRALGAIADKYDIPRLIVAECLLGKDIHIVRGQPEPERTPPTEQRPSRTRGQRKRRHGR